MYGEGPVSRMVLLFLTSVPGLRGKSGPAVNDSLECCPFPLDLIRRFPQSVGLKNNKRGL